MIQAISFLVTIAGIITLVRIGRQRGQQQSDTDLLVAFGVTVVALYVALCTVPIFFFS